MSMQIRILLVDDHAVVREGLRALFDGIDGMQVVAEAGRGEEALLLAQDARPDVAMVDLKMPGIAPTELIRRLQLLVPGCNIIVFTSFADDDLLRDVLQAGAIGYLLKDAQGPELVAAVRAVAQGQPWLHENMQRQLVELLRRPPPTDPYAALTPRERDVLRLIGDGYSNRRIARQLQLTEGTVKGYVSNLLDKLQLDGRTQAALMVARQPVGEA
jgi:DNA-binding NarL/FixJ family response regulator